MDEVITKLLKHLGKLIEDISDIQGLCTTLTQQIVENVQTADGCMDLIDSVVEHASIVVDVDGKKVIHIQNFYEDDDDFDALADYILNYHHLMEGEEENDD